MSARIKNERIVTPLKFNITRQDLTNYRELYQSYISEPDGYQSLEKIEIKKGKKTYREVL